MMRIAILGTRGIPNIPGGVETHCENLYPRIAKDANFEILMIRRKSYVKEKIRLYNNIHIADVFSPKKKSFEAIIHTFLGVIYAKMKHTQVIHIHTIGPSIMVPFIKLLGMKVVMTHHGPDYDRQKWGKIAKNILKLGEKWGVRYADKVIVISDVIKDLIEEKYGRKDAVLIYNGVNLPTIDDQTDFIKQYGLIPKKYIIAVGRFVKEKGLHDLINAFSIIKQNDIKLVLVGDSDHNTKYSKEIKEKAKKEGVVLTGFIKGKKLNQIFSNALLFVMPSYHEGLPIALLEAMSYNLDVLVSDIPANLEVGLKESDYFKTSDVNDLSMKISIKLNKPQNIDFSSLLKKYDWDKIALKTMLVYKQIENSIQNS